MNVFSIVFLLQNFGPNMTKDKQHPHNDKNSLPMQEVSASTASEDTNKKKRMTSGEATQGQRAPAKKARKEKYINIFFVFAHKRAIMLDAQSLILHKKITDIYLLILACFYDQGFFISYRLPTSRTD